MNESLKSLRLQRNKSPFSNGTRAFFKLARVENVITLCCSADNKQWLLVRHLQFNTQKRVMVGFEAQSPTGDKCEVRFADIRYAAKKIKDPYTGD